MAIMDRHQVLRSGFINVDDDEFPFAMITYHSGTFDIPWFEDGDLEVATPSRSDLSKLVLENLHQPAWKVRVKYSESQTWLQFSAVHALYDAQALRIILSEVSRAYRGETLELPIPILPVQSSIVLAGRNKDVECESFWKDMGPNLVVSRFPDMNSKNIFDAKYKVVARSCSESLCTLQGRCKDLGVTLQAAGQASWARLLASYIGESTVTFGLVLSGRTMVDDAQNAVFPCLTTVPSFYNMRGSNRNLLDCIMKLNASLLKHQFTPLSSIYSWTEKDPSLFDTVFVFQKFSNQSNDINNNWEKCEEEAHVEVSTYFSPLS